MKRVLAILTVLALSGTISACNRNETSQPAAPVKVEQKKIVPGQMRDNDLVLAFLAGIQNSDKKLMYEISNITPELVENSRNILTNTAKYKQTKKERTETEHALRMSGSIDFFLKKLTKILPKSAQLQITKTTQENKTGSSVKVHHVKIIYSNNDEALTDKKGQRIKEMAIRLRQTKHLVNGRLLNEFSFKSEDFEKLADSDFEVLSYF